MLSTISLQHEIPQVTSRASLAVDNNSCYVGLMPDGASSRISCSFAITNMSDHAVNIIGQPLCACGSVTVKCPAVIPAGRSGQVEVTSLVNPSMGNPDIRHIGIFGKGMKQPELTLRIVAKRINVVDLFPGENIIIVTTEGTPARERVYVVVREPAKARVELRANLPNDLVATITEVSRSRQMQLHDTVRDITKIFALDLEIGAILQPGRYLKTIEIMTNRKGYESIIVNCLVVVTSR